jgi:hypothetical protein
MQVSQSCRRPRNSPPEQVMCAPTLNQTTIVSPRTKVRPRNSAYCKYVALSGWSRITVCAWLLVYASSLLTDECVVIVLWLCLGLKYVAVLNVIFVWLCLCFEKCTYVWTHVT